MSTREELQAKFAEFADRFYADVPLNPDPSWRNRWEQRRSELWEVFEDECDNEGVAYDDPSVASRRREFDMHEIVLRASFEVERKSRQERAVDLQKVMALSDADIELACKTVIPELASAVASLQARRAEWNDLLEQLLKQPPT